MEIVLCALDVLFQYLNSTAQVIFSMFVHFSDPLLQKEKKNNYVNQKVFLHLKVFCRLTAEVSW